MFVRCNFSDMEIEMFFAKYDVDGDGIFCWDEGMQIINDLDNDTLDPEVVEIAILLLNRFQ